jgi:hypothetical protein
MHIICYKKNLQIPESKKIMQQFLIAMMFYELHYTYKQIITHISVQVTKNSIQIII